MMFHVRRGKMESMHELLRMSFRLNPKLITTKLEIKRNHGSHKKQLDPYTKYITLTFPHFPPSLVFLVQICSPGISESTHGRQGGTCGKDRMEYEGRLLL